MRVFRISFALWYDPFWWSNRRRAWKTRRYWLAAPRQTLPAVTRTRAFALQIGPVTLKWTLQGRME